MPRGFALFALRRASDRTLLVGGLLLALAAGLIADGVARLIDYHGSTDRLPDWDHWELLAGALHMLAVPMLAAGHLYAIVVGLHSSGARRFLASFAYAGRMALTNCVGQSAFYALVLFGVGPGLALAGRMGSTAVVAVVTVAFASQGFPAAGGSRASATGRWSGSGVA